LGGAVGVALLTSVVAAVGPVRHLGRRVLPNLGAYHTGFVVAAAVAIVAAVAALMINDADAAPTMVRRRRRTRVGQAAPQAAAAPAPV
jgi:hypothetical protein